MVCWHNQYCQREVIVLLLEHKDIWLISITNTATRDICVLNTQGRALQDVRGMWQTILSRVSVHVNMEEPHCRYSTLPRILFLLLCLILLDSRLFSLMYVHFIVPPE